FGATSAWCVVRGAWCVWSAGGTGAVQVFGQVLYLQGFGEGTGVKLVQKWFPVRRADRRWEIGDRGLAFHREPSISWIAVGRPVSCLVSPVFHLPSPVFMLAFVLISNVQKNLSLYYIKRPQTGLDR